MRVADLMNRRAAAIVPSATMQRAAELLVLTQASDLCVVDHDNRFLGIVSEGDLIRAAMPDFDEVIAYGASNAQTLEILLETGEHRQRAGRTLIIKRHHLGARRPPRRARLGAGQDDPSAPGGRHGACSARSPGQTSPGG